MMRAIKTKLYRNQGNKRIKVGERFGIKVPNSSIKVLMTDIINNNTLW